LIQEDLNLPDKLPLNQVLNALDRKDMSFYDSLSDEHKKQVAPFLLNRYMSIVKGSSDLHAYYLMATNQRVNKSYFDLAKHPKLVWQLLCTVSPGMGNQFHQWVGFKKKTSDNKSRKVLEKLYPNAKNDELDLLAKTMTKKELKLLAEAHGE
jgi:hypothetical protein|tara:strand:+ start:318 stop:773 length:456 start_codon:yes stop_codon:yes gene_type:complete